MWNSWGPRSQPSTFLVLCYICYAVVDCLLTRLTDQWIDGLNDQSVYQFHPHRASCKQFYVNYDYILLKIMSLGGAATGFYKAFSLIKSCSSLITWTTKSWTLAIWFKIRPQYLAAVILYDTLVLYTLAFMLAWGGHCIEMWTISQVITPVIRIRPHNVCLYMTGDKA